MKTSPRPILFSCAGFLICVAILGGTLTLLYGVFSSKECSRWSRYAAGGSFIGGSPSLSPDGAFVVYSSPRTGRGDIYKTRLDNCSAVRLTDSENYEGDAKFAFDGKQIVFVRQDDGIGHIWIMNEDGSNQRQLTNGDEYDHGPALSADGSKIVFTRRVHDFRFRRGSLASAEIFIMKSDGTELKRLTNNDHADWEASFSPGGDEILYTVDSEEMWTMHEDGSNRRYLGPGASPSYSRDGKRIVFISGEYGGKEISFMNSDGTDRRLIYYSEIYKSSPSFTADGKAIVFLEEHRGRGVGEICMISVDGSGRKVITTTK